MKKFFTSVPFQSDLRLMVYKPPENSELEYNTPNSMPILSAINAYAEEGESIKVYFLIPDNANCLANTEALLQQLDVLVKEKQLCCTVEKIVYNDNDNITTMLELYGRLLKCFDDNDSIYTCITYGTKPLPLVQLMTLRYAYHAKKNILIGSIVYGKAHGNRTNDSGADLYDMTSLFYIDELSDTFCRMSVEDPEEKIASIILGTKE